MFVQLSTVRVHRQTVKEEREWTTNVALQLSQQARTRPVYIQWDVYHLLLVLLSFSK